MTVVNVDGDKNKNNNDSGNETNTLLHLVSSHSTGKAGT